ncbi:hypothetical protein ACODYM_29220 [Burkholderia gladioli]|uniref:hypothetical protein n=1 Tax=Burkholderia gladioli TaxID=28095 RepID=UPI003B50BE82
MPATSPNSQFAFQPGNTIVVDPRQADASIDLAPLDADQKKLKRLVARRQPEYAARISHWTLLQQTYEGGREWYNTNIFQYMKEGQREFADRVQRAYRFNHSREVVDLLNKYLFKQVISRNETDAPASVKAFWARATRNGLGIDDFSRQVGKKSSIFGRIGIVIDNTRSGDTPISIAEQKQAGVQTYAYTVTPDQMLDYSFDELGELNWILIAEAYRDDEDPMDSSGEVRQRYRLWTKTEWRLLEEVREGRRVVIKEIDSGAHNLGVVPLVFADNIITDEKYTVPSLIEDIVYLDRAAANYLSNLDAIIQDQTFSQLAMPAQNVLPGSDNYTTLLDMGTKRVFLYDGESGAQPHYLSPDPKQAQMILAVVNKIINEIYHTVGLAGERTKQDNALGIDNSSGVAKAYDFERVNALLSSKASSLELVERRIAYIVALWNGEEGAFPAESLITYPRNFDTRGLYDEFDIAARLMLIEAPASVRQEQMKSTIDKLFPQLAKDLKEKMLADLKDWPPPPGDPNGDTPGQEFTKQESRTVGKEATTAT